MQRKSGSRPRTTCRRCRYYAITHDPFRPRACRAYGFVSRRIPAQVVLDSSGQGCRLYEPSVRNR